MKTIQWQALNTGGGNMIYGADFEEAPSISLSEECLLIIKEGLTFDKFWDLYTDELAEQRNSRGLIFFTPNLSIVDFHKFLTRHNLENYLAAIIDKHRVIS